MIEQTKSERPICKKCGREEVFGSHEFLPGRFTCRMRTGRAG